MKKYCIKCGSDNVRIGDGRVSVWTFCNDCGLTVSKSDSGDESWYEEPGKDFIIVPDGCLLILASEEL